MTFHQEPLGLKQPRADDNPAYLAAVRQLPCIICVEFGMRQQSRTEAHHVFHGRFSQRKSPDEAALRQRLRPHRPHARRAAASAERIKI